MRRSSVFTMLVAFALASLLPNQDAQAQLAKNGTYTGKYVFSENVLKAREVEKDRIFLLSENLGIFLNDAGEGFLHATSAICQVFGVVKAGRFTGNGSCVFTDKDGHKAFSLWSCTPMPGADCAGTSEWAGGTGKYQGLKGKNTFVSYPAIGGTTEAIVDWKGEWRLP